MKGSFSLLAIKSPEIALRISACNLQVFFSLFQEIKKDKKIELRKDFTKFFNYCYETVRGLLIYAKEGRFDQLFANEKIPT